MNIHEGKGKTTNHSSSKQLLYSINEPAHKISLLIADAQMTR